MLLFDGKIADSKEVILVYGVNMNSKNKKIKNIEKTIDKIAKTDYGYYYDDRMHGNIIKKALEMERNYRLNCSDAPKDFSPEAEARRFKMYIRYLTRR